MDEYVLTKGKYFMAQKIEFKEGKTNIHVNVIPADDLMLSDVGL